MCEYINIDNHFGLIRLIKFATERKWLILPGSYWQQLSSGENVLVQFNIVNPIDSWCVFMQRYTQACWNANFTCPGWSVNMTQWHHYCGNFPISCETTLWDNLTIFRLWLSKQPTCLCSPVALHYEKTEYLSNYCNTNVTIHQTMNAMHCLLNHQLGIVRTTPIEIIRMKRLFRNI